MQPTLSIDVITDDAGLADLWGQWEDLWQRAGSGVPFLAPAWLAPWWQVFGTGRPLVAVLHDAAGLAGVLPFYRLGDKLLPMGVGISDYFDVLLSGDAQCDAPARLLAAALRASDAARLDLPDLPEGAILCTTAAPTGWRAEATEGPVCPVLALQPELAIPKTMRRDLRQAGHRADRSGAWRIETATRHTLSELLEGLIALHAARWGERDEQGVLADPRVLAFHRSAAAGLLEAGLLRLCALRLRDRIAAVVYALTAADRICFYLGGFDPADAFISPGILLIGQMLGEAAHDGCGEAHFLRGGESYKHALGARDRRNLCRGFVRQ